MTSAGDDLRPAVAPPDLDPPAGEDAKPPPWDWAHLTDTDAARQADALERFVDYFNHRYAWTREQTIPACWARHGALTEEATTLMWSRWAAFQGPLASAEAAQAWHTYHLPLFLARITSWTGLEAVADCRSGHHQPSRLTGVAPALNSALRSATPPPRP